MSTAAQDEFNALFADKNRISRHPQDEADSSSDAEDTPAEPTYYEKDSDVDDDDDDDIDNTGPSSSSASNMRSRYFLPKQRSEANTGPKGVIADAQAFNEAKAKRFSFRAARNLPQSVYQRYASNNHVTAESAVRDPEKSSDDDEDEFLETWRQSRLKELQQPTSKRMSALGTSRGHSPPGGGRRTYGSLVAVDGEGYLDAIEKSEVSNLVEDCVRQLARSHPLTRFVKLHYEDAEMEGAGVPAILAYRGAEKFAGLVPVVDEIPDDADLSAVTLQQVLR
ncbi:hypothetical protein LTS18_004386, partial [Coniosporium uncinatum]